MPPIANQRALFGIPDHIAYFNCASLAPLLPAAQAAGRAALERRGEPWGTVASDWFEGSERRRSLLAQLVGASPENIALVPASSYGLAVAARNLTARSGQRVLTIADEFPSNAHTWRAFCARRDCELITVVRKPDQQWTDAVLAAIDERVAIAAIPTVHWTDGALLDLHAIGERLRGVGARVVVDASQSLGAMPFDFDGVRPDFVVAVGYKWLLGPLGLGYLYVADAHLGGEPLEENWISREGSEDFAALVNYRDEYRAGARRFDMGQHTAFELGPVAIAALEQLVHWTVPAIAEALAVKTARIATAAEAVGTPVTSRAHGPHLVGLRVAPGTVAAAGAHLKARDVYVGVRGDTLRIAPHLYNDERDIDRLIESLVAFRP